MLTTNVRYLKVITFAFAMLSIALASTALASEPETHDGFMLRFVTGLGFQSTSEDGTGGSVGTSGLSGTTALALGGVIVPNLAIHGELFLTTITDPTWEVRLDSGAGVSEETKGSIVSDGLGVGVTYFMMPLNLYLSGTVGIGKSTAELNNQSYETDTGFGLNLLVGKEWWVSEEAGIGVAGQLIYVSVPDDSEDLNTVSGAVLFSVTYN